MLIYIKSFFTRSDVRIIIVGTLTGGILQIISRKYLQTHPDFFKKSAEPSDLVPRGGEFLSGSAAIAQVILSFLSEHGLTAGLLSSVGVVVSQVPLNSISTCLRHSIPQNLSHLEKKKFIIIDIDGKKIYLDQCDESLKYLFDILADGEILTEDRREVALSVIRQYADLKTPSGRRNFVLCTAFVMYTLFHNQHSSFFLMMRSLIQAIREGKITKPIARLIVRKLRKQGISIDPELVEVIAS